MILILDNTVSDRKYRLEFVRNYQWLFRIYFKEMGIAAEILKFCSNPFRMDKVSLKNSKAYIYSMWITLTE